MTAVIAFVTIKPLMMVFQHFHSIIYSGGTSIRNRFSKYDLNLLILTKNECD